MALRDETIVQQHGFGPQPWEFGISEYLNIPRMQGIVDAFLKVLRLPGDVAEFGIAKGETLRQLGLFMHAHGVAKALHGFDTFTGLPEPEPVDNQSAHLVTGLYRHSMSDVKEYMTDCGTVVLHEGLIKNTGPSFKKPLCFAAIDCDLYAGTYAALQVCGRVIVPGGVVVLDDYETHWVGVTAAVQKWWGNGKKGWRVERPVYNPDLHAGQLQFWRDK